VRFEIIDYGEHQMGLTKDLRWPSLEKLNPTIEVTNSRLPHPAVYFYRDVLRRFGFEKMARVAGRLLY
jgi:hypothetical protein